MQSSSQKQNRSSSAHVRFCALIWREAADIGQLERSFWKKAEPTYKGP